MQQGPGGVIEKEKPKQTKAEVLAQTTREGDGLCSACTHPTWEAASGGSTGRGEWPALRLLLELQIGFCGWPFSLSGNKSKPSVVMFVGFRKRVMGSWAPPLRCMAERGTEPISRTTSGQQASPCCRELSDILSATWGATATMLEPVARASCAGHSRQCPSTWTLEAWEGGRAAAPGGGGPRPWGCKELLSAAHRPDELWSGHPAAPPVFQVKKQLPAPWGSPGRPGCGTWAPLIACVTITACFLHLSLQWPRS